MTERDTPITVTINGRQESDDLLPLLRKMESIPPLPPELARFWQAANRAMVSR